MNLEITWFSEYVDNRYRLVFIWFCINLAPQLLLSIVSLSLAVKKDFWRVVSRYPPLLLCPVFTVFTFGPRQAAVCGGRWAWEKSLVLSKRMTMVNIVLTLLTNLAVFGFSIEIHGNHLLYINPTPHLDDNSFSTILLSIAPLHMK